jgi:nuclear GTP-binding protein
LGAPQAWLTRFKTAEPDQILAARIVLHDWNTGKFPRFTLPPSDSPSTFDTSDTARTKAYGQDDGVLSRLKTRSEFRKSGGLVKMNSGEIDKRTLVLDAEWASPEDSEPSEDEDGDEEIVDFYGNDGDDEEEDEEDDDDDEDEDENGDEEGDEEEGEEESETELPPPPPKRKRAAEPSKGSAAPPKKKVAFDLQKPAKGAGPSPRSAPLRSNLKKPTFVSKRRP